MQAAGGQSPIDILGGSHVGNAPPPGFASCLPLKNVQRLQIRFIYNILVRRKRTKLVPQIKTRFGFTGSKCT